jgi:molecular chaperone DnaJ
VSACPRCRGEGKIVEAACETCHGEGRVERRKKIRVTIPAGIDEGHQVRLSGEGEVGPRGGPAGSLYVAVHVQPHKQLKREGTELYYELDVSMTQAALGTRATIPTVEGPEEIEVRPGTQPGTELRLRGRGVPHVRRSGSRGDLHVFVRVTVPTRLTKDQRDHLEAYARDAGEEVADHGGIIDRVRDALG